LLEYFTSGKCAIGINRIIFHSKQLIFCQLYLANCTWLYCPDLIGSRDSITRYSFKIYSDMVGFVRIQGFY
jgi:hypothetical protein